MIPSWPRTWPRSTPRPTKRSLNQAFFTRLYVTPEWDDEQGQTTAWITGAKLTAPYALLLADDLVPGVLAEVEAITATAAAEQDAKKASESQIASPKPLAAGCSYFDVMAERAGFEPAMEFNPHTRLAGECLQPLGHLSPRERTASVASRAVDVACGSGRLPRSI